MKSNKSPGLDGLTVEFYREFWGKVNFRPNSLLNVDLKLLSYVLAQRLKKVLEKIVNNDQTGYI